MKNIICIDLDMYEFDELDFLAKDIRVPKNILKRAKKNRRRKIYIYDSKIIAYETRREPGIIHHIVDFLKSLKSIEPQNNNEKGREMLNEETTIDGVLNKILRYGVDSLTQREKDIFERAKQIIMNIKSI